MEKKVMVKLISAVLAAALWIVIIFAARVTVQAAPAYGFGADQGRTDTVNINDYHTSQWDRFNYNYEFSSGIEYRYDLGKPNVYEGYAPADVYSVNVRRDANISLFPPGYGIFSGFIPTAPSNQLFPRPVNPSYWGSYELQNPNIIPRYDTMQIGVNAQPAGNPMNMYNVGQTGTLPNTSVGGDGIIPNGANNMTGNYFKMDGTVYNQSGNNSSTVTAPSAGGFLPSTSIK
jgi:hypothetical protein